MISARGAQDASSGEFDPSGSSLTIGRSVMRYSVVLSARLLPETAPPEAGTYIDSVTVTFNLYLHKKCGVCWRHGKGSGGTAQSAQEGRHQAAIFASRSTDDHPNQEAR
jgi:hypothetical protein